MNYTTWAAFKKAQKRGEFDNYEREPVGSLSVVDKDEETRRRYQEYVQQVMDAQRQDDIVRQQIEDSEKYTADTIAKTKTQPSVMVTAGAAAAPAQPSPRYANPYEEPPTQEQINKDNLDYIDRAKERIQAEHDSKHSLFGKDKAKARLDELGSQADDVRAFNMDDSNDGKILSDLDTKIKNRGTLTPDEEVAYSEAKIRAMYKQHDGLDKLMNERNAYYSVINDYRNGNDTSGRAKYAMYTAEDKLKNVEDRIKQLTGWTDEEFKSNMQYVDRVIDRQDTQAVAGRYEIDKNASTLQKVGKGISNSVYSLARNGAIANANAIYNDLVEDRPRGFGANIDDPSHRLVNQSNAAVAQTSERIKQDAGEGAQYAYDTGYSAADSLVKRIPAMLVTSGLGSVAGEVVGLVPYALSAYNSGYEEARQRGATEKEAKVSAITQGAIETLTEIIPVGNAVGSLAGKEAGKSVVKRFVKQMIEEGAEEAVGTIVTEIADGIIFNDDPEVQTKWKERVEKSGSFGGAVADLVSEAAKDFASGALSTIPMAGINIGVSNRQYNRMSQNISETAKSVQEAASGDTEYEKSLKAQAEQYEKNPTRWVADNLSANTEEEKKRKAEVMELAKKEASGEKLTTGEKMFIQEAIAESSQKEQKDQSNVPLEYRDKVSNLNEDEARTMLAEAAVNGDVNAFIDAIQMTRNSSNEEVAKNAEQIIGDYSGMAQTHGITAQAIGQARITRLQAYKAGLKGENLTDLSDTNKEAYNAGQIEAINQKARTTVESNALKNMETTTKEGKTVTLQGAFTSEGVQTSDGAVKLENIDLADTATARAYQYADRFDNVNVKNAFISNIKDGQNIEQYRSAFDKMYDSAMAGVSYENAKNSIASEFVDENVLKAAYQTGETERSARSYASLSEALGYAKAGKGQVVVESSKASADMVDFYDKLARRTGLTFKIVDEMSQEGARGSFQVSESTITVKADKATAVFHELGEFTETYNKKEYDALRNAIADFSSKKLGNDKYMRFLNQYKSAYEKAGQDSSADEMSGEMFNDTISIMMRSDKGRNALADYLAQNYSEAEAKTIGQQAADYIKKLAKAVKKAFSKSSGYEAEMEKYADELGEYADQFISALDKAIQNYQSTEGVGDGDEKFSITVESTEEERYNELKDKIITIPQYNEDVLKNDGQITLSKLETMSLNKARKALKKLGERLGIFDHDYMTQDLDVVFDYSKQNLRESIDKQVAVPMNTKMPLFAKMLTGFDDVIKNAYLIEAHKDRYKNTPREDRNLRQMFVLASAFQDEVYIYPVKLEIKDFIKGQKDKLYVSIVLPAIEKSSLGADASRTTSSEHSEGELSSDYKLSDLLTKVKENPASADLGKYIPSQFKASEAKLSLDVDSQGKELTDGQKEYFADESPLLLDENGSLKRYYHGTARMDRVGTVFDPARATSGPMAFFTDNKSIAENYARDKEDTSLSRDERYDSYYTQFRLNINGKDVSVPEAWNMLPASKKAEIKKKAGHIAFDDDYEEIAYYEDKEYGNGAFSPYEVNRHKGNYLETLVDTWLETGDLLDREEDFLKVLELVGIDGAEYLDPYARNEGVYEVYIHATNPLDTTNIPKKVVSALKKASKTASYDDMAAVSDSWDKNRIEPEEWMERLEDNIKENSTTAWTSIPDWVTDTLKSLGYDAIADQGGKFHDYGHQVVIPFESNQVKNIDNENPSVDPDIRFSLDIEDDRIMYVRGLKNNIEVVKNPTDAEYKQMMEDYYEEYPWAREWKDEPIFRHTYDEEGNTYYWVASQGLHSQIEPEINKRYNTRTSQQYKWWEDDDKDFWPTDYSTRYSIEVEHANKAEKHFGTTNKYALAGYLDINGKLLNFSDGQRYRVQDHREISDILDLGDDAGYSDGLIQFMAEGNIRMQEYGIDISKAPNEKQKPVLLRFFDSLDGEVSVDFSAENGDNVGSAEYAEGTKSQKILNDIERYFKTGNVPEGNAEYRYSLTVNSEGKKLTKDQQKYFKNVSSELRDENGALKVMYHGTSEANFTIFDPKFSDDNISLFFTDSRFVAASYAGTEDYVDINNIRQKGSIKTIEDLKKRFEDTDYGVREEDGQIIIEEISDPDDPVEYIREDSVEDAYREWVEQYSWNGEEGEFGGLYEVYLNITNPLVVDAHESNWEEIFPEEIVDDDAEFYDKIQVIKKNDDGTFVVDWRLSGGNGGTTETMTDNQFREKFGDEMYNKFIEQGRNLWEGSVIINPGGEIVPKTTRELALYARNKKYDGLIINNLIDMGKYGSYDEASQVVIAFNSSQVKSIYNEHPTEDNDIRYSIEVDSKDRILSDGQQKYFNNSKAVDGEGRLKVMYHGARRAGFTVFNADMSDDKRSFFFTDSADIAKTYSGTHDMFAPDKPMTFEELSEMIDGYTGRDRYLAEEGNDVVIYEVGMIGEDDTEIYRGSLKGAQEEFGNMLNNNTLNGDANYEVYLNLQNPLIMDAKGANWDELNQDAARDKHFGDVQINKVDNGYDVEWMGQDFEWRHETFKSMKELEATFGKIYEPFEYGELFISDIYLDKDGNRIPTNTRMLSQMAQEQGHDGVIIKNLYDIGLYASSSEHKASTVAIAFNPEQIKSVYNLNPTSSEDIRYSLDLPDGDEWVDFDAILSGSSVTEEKAVDILEKGMEALKNKEVDIPKLRTLALKIRNEYGSSYNANTLTENLQKAFAYMQTEDHVDYKTMMGILKDIARPVIEQSGEKVGEQEYKDFLSYFKGKKIKLTEKQKEEVRYAYGTYGAFRNAMMPITISDNADVTLDQLWDEMVEQSGHMLDMDATEGDMPLNLLDTLQAMRPTVRNDFNGDSEDVARDLAMRIVQEYVEGEAAKEMKKEISEYRAKLKKDYQERAKKLRGEANAEARAKNKRRSEEAKEREEVRNLKHDIKISANKLLTWVEKPSEGKSVPHNMIVPVMQFLQAIDFVDPVITQTEDGKWHTRVFDHLDYENGQKRFRYNDLVGDTYEDVLRQFNEALGRGEGSKEQRSWTEKMQGIREIYDKVLKDSDFDDNSMDFLMQTLDAQGLAEDLGEMLSRNRGSLNMNHLNSRDLKLIDNIIKNIFHAVNQGNKAYSSNADIADLAQSTIRDAEGKEIKSRGKTGEGVYKMLRLDNVTPRTFFKLLGTRGSEVYKFIRHGLNQEIVDLKKASEFMEGAMQGIDARKWTGKDAVVHEFAISSGTIRMTDAQIMGLYCTVRRKGGMERIVGGIKVDDIVRKGASIKQNKAMHLTQADIAKIEAVLTPEQIALAKKMQKYMADDCSAMGNETSMKLYGFKKFTDDTYYPWKADRSTIATTNSSENIPMFTGIERSGFTKQLKEGANNPLVIRDIFDVFTDHVSEMASYHGYAASVKDTLRWLNYKEKDERSDGFVTWRSNKDAINALVNDEQGVSYITKLLLDINKANKSQYIGNFTDKLIGNYKAAAVGANLRVVAQQPTAYFRALNMIDAKYLMTVNPKKAMKNIKKSQEECPISWWKSKGYYETNLGQPIKEIVTGIASPAEKMKDIMMKPAGWADDFTWGFLYTAVEKEQRDKFKGQNISAEEFRKAVNERFDDVIDNTQVVDSTLHRSQYMRSNDRLNKLQTAFMAEPTKSYNMLLEAAVEDMREGKPSRTPRAVAAFLISSIATSAAAAVVDALRKTRDDEKWWEVWLNNLKENIADNVNPFNLLPVVKDVSAGIYNFASGESTYGQSGNRFDIEAISSVIDAIRVWSKVLEGEGNKTGYGVFMSTIKPISQITGIPAYNMVKDSVALYNAFFDNIETNISSGSTAKNAKKKDFVSDVNKEKSEETLDQGIIDALNSGVSIYDLKGAVQSEYKNKYFDLYADGKEDEAKELADKAARAYARMGLSDEDIDEIINGWQEEVITYSALDKAIASGEGIEEEVKHVQEAKDDDKIIDHIMNRYAETVAFEDTHDTESSWRENVEKALQTVDPTLDFDTANEEAMQKKAEKEAKAEQTAHNQEMKNDFFDAVEKKDGSAGRKALQTMKDEGIEAKTVKSAVSTKYHDAWKEAKSQAEKDKAKSDWKSAYTLVNNVYGSSSNDLDQTWAEWEKKQK